MINKFKPLYKNFKENISKYKDEEIGVMNVLIHIYEFYRNEMVINKDNPTEIKVIYDKYLSELENSELKSYLEKIASERINLAYEALIDFLLEFKNEILNK